MSGIAELLYSRRVPKAAALAFISFSFAGCSADMSTRFSENPFYSSNTSRREATASVPSPRVERRELPQYSRPQPSALPPVVSAPQSYPVSQGVSGGGRGLSSYAPPAQPQLESTSAVPQRSVAARPVGQGGTTIIVGTSDTLDALARRYHVTPEAILAANGYKGPRTLSPGQQLIIPRPTAVAAAAPAAPVAAVAKPVVAASSNYHFVNRGDTLMGIARQNHISVGELAKANHLDASAKLKPGDKLIVPGVKAAAATPVAPVAAPVAQPAAVATPPLTRVAAAAPQHSARLVQPSADIEDKPTESPAKASEATGALPTFRWPARGKVVAGYGAKTNGKSNDGINLAVPEGTPIKAAEDGVVAYSGNELKGYGNLILVRHSNGYVTAYAHASELLVKRGDTIKRGQVIAKSGQSGEVASPQLHFEIRKGSSPVDPLQFLNGA